LVAGFKNFDLAELAKFIDWGPFFQTWDLAGPFPAILKDEVVGTEAVRVYADAKRMLNRLIEGRWLAASGVMGLYPANSVGDDIEIYLDETRAEVAMTWHGLRQQTEKTAVDGVMRPSRCLADFIAPKTLTPELNTGLQAKMIPKKILKQVKFPITLPFLPSQQAWALKRKKSTSRTTTTITRPSCSKRWLTAWPRPLRNACTSGCGRTYGAMQPTRRWT
jgi:Vitamin B12 dependent methionine synthase, activation domain